MPRALDHLVIAVHDIEAARGAWQRLGFTVSPARRDPVGTATARIGMVDGAYIELLAIADPSSIAEPEVGAFSFAAFNRDFIAAHEGLSTVVLRSDDPDADSEAFEAAGLQAAATLDLERTVLGPDGTERTVTLAMAVAGERRLRQTAFLTCRPRLPDGLGAPAFEPHANGALQIASTVLVTRDPADFHEFVGVFSGQRDMSSTSLGVAFSLDGGAIEVLSPVGYSAWFGALTDPDPRRLLACRIVVADLDATRTALDRETVPYAARQGAVVVPPGAATGVAVAFVAEKTLVR